ncbi:MAG: T9SS type A sorting domain-containing protein [Bacteroidales bacterium]|nr:T9SS type A sorting domain-containing protein [Bacteroidales bacterium]
MKNLILLLTVQFFVFLPHTLLKANLVNDTISMGPGYTNDVFYSLENGTVKTEPRNNWDLAFYTVRWSAGVMINDGMGVVLYTYPYSDTTGWQTMDVTDIESWKPVYNSDTIWEEGAFNANSLEHPDYGWGVYNMVTHDVIGDSLFVLQLADGSLKKIWIQRKNSTSNTYYFKYANIDGSGEVAEVLNVNDFTDKHFVYYSISNQSVVDREPSMESWDILFSRFMGTTFDNEGNPSRYPVVGVLNNPMAGSNRFQPVGQDFEDWNSLPMIFERSVIGHDWKQFDMELFQWLLADDLVYFVKTVQEDVYKLTFDYFGGTSNGKTGLQKTAVSLASIGQDIDNLNGMKVSPNPASEQLVVSLEEQRSTSATFKIFNQTGSLIHSQVINPLQSTINISLQNFRNGMYLILIDTEKGQLRGKFLVIN